MNPDWLSQLAPAHAPAAPPWWPPAPGWWGLMAVACLLAAAAILWHRNPQRRVRHAALAELSKIRAEPDRIRLAQSLQNLLRRYALTVLPRERVAPLTGEAWLALLAGEGAAALGGAAGRSLLTAAFGGAGSDDRQVWLASTEAFVRKAGARPLLSNLPNLSNLSRVFRRGGAQ